MEERTINMVDMLSTVFKKWLLALLVAVLGCALGLAFGAYKNNKYNAQAKAAFEKKIIINDIDVEGADLATLLEKVLSSTDVETVKRVINNEAFLEERKEYLKTFEELESLDPEQYWYVHNIEDTIVSTRANISKDKDNFSDNMKRYYAVLSGDDSIEIDVDELKKLAKSKVPVYTPVSLISKKFGLLGFAGGLVATFGIVALIYILDPRVRVCDDIKAMFGVNVIGHIGGKHGKNNLSEEESVNLVCSSIALRLKKDNISEITVMGCNMELGQKKYSEIIARNLKNIKISIADKAIYDSKELVKLEDAAHVVLLEKANKTTCREIEEEVNLCKESGIEVVGIVFIA